MSPAQRRLESIAKQFSSSASTSKEPMSASTSDDALIIQNSNGGLRTLTLNRAKVLNALNSEMIQLMRPMLEQWEKTDAVNAVVLKGTGRAFCSGGDVATVVTQAKESKTRDQAVGFFQQEYTLNNLLARMTKPVVALIDGITMGGGLGLSLHAPFRVATEKTRIAMPETTIGLFPDVGADFFLSRMDGQIGLYLGLTSEELKGWSVFQSGVASHYIPSHRLQEVEDQLANLETPNSSSENFEKINSTLESFALDPLAAKQEKYSLGGQFRNVVDFVFGKGSIEAIMSALTEIELGKQPNFDHDSLKEWARAAKQKLALRSPTSCKMFIKAFEMAKTQSVGEVLLTDLRLAASCCDPNVTPDFIEGVTYRLIEKKPRDGRPNWQPSTFEKVNKTLLDKIFTTKDEALPPLVDYQKSLPGKDYHQYPYRKFSLPSEADLITVIDKAKGKFEAAYKLAVEKFGNKFGLEVKLQEVLQRLQN